MKIRFEVGGAKKKNKKTEEKNEEKKNERFVFRWIYVCLIYEHRFLMSLSSYKPPSPFNRQFIGTLCLCILPNEWNANDELKIQREYR